jgi:hypothetical protein
MTRPVLALKREQKSEGDPQIAGTELEEQRTATTLILTTQTIRNLDAIQTRLSLRSRGQALDMVITYAWRRFKGPFPVPTDGSRETEVLARIEAMRRARLCSGTEVVRSAIEQYKEDMVLWLCST